MKAYLVHWVVVDLDSGFKRPDYRVIAECPEKSTAAILGAPYPKFLVDALRTNNESRIIPSEIASDKTMLSNHLFIATGLKWVVF